MNRKIRKVAVLGSGVMGSRIACHFANIGIEVLLLDIVPKELTEQEKAKGVKADNKNFKNKIVNEALLNAIKANPSPLYDKSFEKRITTGNFDDNFKDLGNYDWIIEVVVENLKIKQSVFEKVELFRKPGTIISSNTSGIPIHLMADGRSEDFKKHFCGTHFFNPPRYLKLLEIIPTQHTDSKIIDFLMHYGDLHLGKTTVLCKDTPAFIANRVGIYSIMASLKVMEELDLNVDDVDKLTGPVIGRPKSATFRTADVVGLDTLIKVANNLFAGLPNDEGKDVFNLPPFINQLDEKKWYGDKSGQGFYKKTKSKEGKTEILTLNLKTFDYEMPKKSKFGTLDQTKSIEQVKDRYKVLVKGTDKAGEFYKKTFSSIFAYVSNRIPEISDELYRIDQAIEAGFGWDYGPFATWDAIGVKEMIPIMESLNFKPAQWVYDMTSSGANSFYKLENGKKLFYDIPSKTYKEIPGAQSFIILDNLRSNKKIWGNSGATVLDLGDGIINLEFHTKMNTMGSEVIEGIHKALTLAENDFRGLVIGNDAPNFSAGANLAMLLMFAIDQEYDEIDLMIRQFQKTMMRVRYSSIPVVVAPHGLSLGGGCEITLHADKVQAYAETYIGLVEFGVGLIPAGGGTKEFTLRVSDAMEEGDLQLNSLKNAYMHIATAKVATSAHEARQMGILRHGDGITINSNRLIADAKNAAILLAEEGYSQPKERKDIKVLGKAGLGMFYAGAYSMYSGKYISAHDKLISEKLAYIMCGGDLSSPTMVSEHYLLDLEREAFLSLTGEKKTLERIQSILTTGKPLRN